MNYQILMNSDKNEVIKQFMKESSSENFNESITNIINSIDSREGIEFWRSVSEEQKKIVIDNIMEVKKEYFGYTNRSINFDFINSIIKACLVTQSYKTAWYSLQRMFENNKSKTAKLGLIQQFYTVASRVRIRKSDPDLKGIVSCLDEEYNSILSTNIPFDFKFMNLCVRSIIANLQYCLSSSPSPNKTTSDLCNFVFENKLDNINFLPLLKFSCLVLEMTSKKFMSIRLKNDYNVDYMNMVISQFENIMMEAANSPNQGSNNQEFKPYPRVMKDRVLTGDILNVFIQGLIIKNVEYWKQKAYPLLQYAESSRYTSQRKGFSNWLMNELQAEKIEDLGMKELILLIQISSQLSFRYQTKGFKLKLLKAVNKNLDSVKSIGIMINILQLCSTFSEISRTPEEQDEAKDKFKLSQVDADTIRLIVKQCQEKIDAHENWNKFGFYELKILIEVYLRQLRLMNQEEFKQTKIYARFDELSQKTNSLTSEFNLVLEILESFDVKGDVQLLQKTLSIFQKWLEGAQRTFSTISQYDKKRMRLYFTKMNDKARYVEEENMKLIDQISEILITIEDIKFERNT